MKLSKSARYALYAAMEMAQATDRLVPVGEVARRYRVSEGALAKVLQQLVRSGLAIGTRGVGGGYRLARLPREVSVLDVIRVFSPPRPSGACLLADAPQGVCHLTTGCRLQRLFNEVDELVSSTCASVSLETLTQAAGGVARRLDAEGG